jgi:hypothetical protein
MNTIGLVLSIIIFLISITLIIIYIAMKTSKQKPEPILPKEEEINPDLEPSIMVNFSDDTEFRGHKFFKVIARRPVKNGVYLYLKPSDWGNKKFNPNEIIMKLCEPGKNLWDFGKAFSPFQNTLFYIPDEIEEINNSVLQTPVGKTILVARNNQQATEMQCVAYKKTIGKMQEMVDMVARSVDDNELREKIISIKNMEHPQEPKEERAS